MDVVGRMCTELIYRKHQGAVCGCLEALAASGHQEEISEVVQFLARMHRPDVIAQVPSCALLLLLLSYAFPA